ncbi:hypothetical protein FAUST_10821 [Fusarium austroamericanum]|uniref:Uncharacterized protein n=1 Tax=Fusarium austroamericanum TaxID=282268 RepID=A0AAN5Z085_FUSAU|nr:hypothetical protein FAUST_10821 [Fusarium austroamericanum]
MSSKRQLAHHDHSGNSVAKRQHLELFMSTTSPSSQSNAPSPICFGTLCEVQAKSVGSLDAESTPKSNGSHRLVTRDPDFFLFNIHVHDGLRGFTVSGSNIFVMIDLMTAKKLEALGEQAGVFTKAVVESKAVKGLSRKSTKSPFETSVNIYGYELDARDIGQQLSKVGAFLQHPFYLEEGVEYLNPQFFHPQDGPRYMTHLVGMDEPKFQGKVFSDVVEGVLSSLDNGLPNLGINDPEIILTDDLITPLQETNKTSHQKTALSFILRHETPEYCQQVGRELLFHTRVPSHKAIPSLSLGGILADVMGLGKTLTILVSIYHSRCSAENFQNTNIDVDMDQPTYPRTSATHFRDGSIRVNTFHGESRSTQSTSLMNYDIVLTTFATLVSDCKRHKVLQSVEWFRVVLDEAHWIRNPSSKQFKAADSLATERRWCLSGTPIQNCINDLVSLLRFFKFEPFSNMDVFRQYILEPLRTENVLGSTNPLQMLLQSVCLRRTEKYLNLPAAHYELMTLSLHHDEQNLYSDVFRKYRSELDDLVSSLTKMDKKKVTLRFSMISELRRLCNHGTLLEPPKTLDDATLNASCDYCNAAEKDNMAKLNGDSMCPECQRSLSPSTPSHSNSRSQSVQLSSLEEPARIHLGLSTKLQSVADNICLRSKSTDRVSLVFSYWTTTLNLLQTLLEDRGIVLRRIDGSLGNGERLRVLNEFKNDPAISVLLITMQTGAVGLTLTVATQVHIIEPQWNPSVEEQAIARALRMGQSKSVKVFRYIMKNTVEERILALQKKKRDLVKFTIDGNSRDGVSGTLEDLKFILDI